MASSCFDHLLNSSVDILINLVPQLLLNLFNLILLSFQLLLNKPILLAFNTYNLFLIDLFGTFNSNLLSLLISDPADQLFLFPPNYFPNYYSTIFLATDPVLDLLTNDIFGAMEQLQILLLFFFLVSFLDLSFLL